MIELQNVSRSFGTFKANDVPVASGEEQQVSRSQSGVPYVSRQQQAPKFMGDKPSFKLNH